MILTVVQFCVLHIVIPTLRAGLTDVLAEEPLTRYPSCQCGA